MVLDLTREGADVDTQDADRMTPFHHAAKEGYEAVVKLLLEKGAAIEAEDEEGRTPLYYAARSGHQAVQGAQSRMSHLFSGYLGIAAAQGCQEPRALARWELW